MSAVPDVELMEKFMYLTTPLVFVVTPTTYGVLLTVMVLAKL
jgi:hypothetical protein